MSFVKLDCGILDSTLWFDKHARDVFITALLMAEPFELQDSMLQIQVDSLDLTGWVIPPGWYGFVAASAMGILHRAGEDSTTGLDALRTLGSPELSSRSSDFDGRRLVRIDGGFLVLNFIKYREKDTSGADRQRRWRERQKVHETAPSPRKRNAVTVTPSRVIRNQAEAEYRVQKQKTEDDVRTDGPGRSLVVDRKTFADLEKLHPIKALLTEHERLFRLHVGSAPHYTGKDAKLASQLITQHGYDAVVAMLPALFTSLDPFVRQSGRDMAILSSCWNKLLVQAAPAVQMSENTTKTTTAGARWLAKQKENQT